MRRLPTRIMNLLSRNGEKHSVLKIARLGCIFVLDHHLDKLLTCCVCHKVNAEFLFKYFTRNSTFVRSWASMLTRPFVSSRKINQPELQPTVRPITSLFTYS